MSKKVIYNGGVQSFYPCTDPTKVLEIGKGYEVEKEIEENSQVLYKLKGIEGEFNSIWFQEAKPIKIGTAEELPVIGNRMQTILFGEGFVKTSPIINVKHCHANVWTVETEKTLYILTISR